MLKAANCPLCNSRLLFEIEHDDIDHSGRYPSPAYVKHNSTNCGGWITVYFDSRMRVTLTSKGKEDIGDKWKFVKEIESKS